MGACASTPKQEKLDLQDSRIDKLIKANEQLQQDLQILTQQRHLQAVLYSLNKETSAEIQTLKEYMGSRFAQLEQQVHRVQSDIQQTQTIQAQAPPEQTLSLKCDPVSPDNLQDNLQQVHSPSESADISKGLNNLMQDQQLRQIYSGVQSKILLDYH